MFKRFKRNPLIHTLTTLKGNERACLYLEPLWGIPYNLYCPFVSVYMAALGMNPFQIGVVTSVFFASQMVWSLLSGSLTDKLGRRTCTVIFDVLSWSVPTLLWMLAQDMSWFVVAAVFNGAWRVTENSWNLLLIEEAPNEKLMHLFSITHIAGLIAGFVAPIPYFFVQTYSVVPTMRVLYGITFVMMTAKFLLLFALSHETEVGKRRMAESKNQSLPRYIWGSGKVLKMMLRDKRIMLTVGLIACFATMKNVSDTFWPLLVTDRLNISTENLSIFATIKTLIMLAMYFVLVPKVQVTRFGKPMAIGFLALLGVTITMILLPPGAYAAVLLAVAVEAAALSILNPLTSSLQMINAASEERARIVGLFYSMCLMVTSPFGLIAGALSNANRTYPFYMIMGLIFCALVITWQLSRQAAKEREQAPAAAQGPSTTA